MTIDLDDLSEKLTGKRIDGIDMVAILGEPLDVQFALPRLRLVDPFGDVTYIVFSPMIEASPDPSHHAALSVTATINFIIQNVNQEEVSNDKPTAN